MAQSIKNVALVGARGYTGSAILKALKSADFNVTVLARTTGTDVPPDVAVKTVDFSSVASLTAAIKGNEAVIDASGSPDPANAIRIMDAAVAAGVDRFIPGEFSNDPRNAAVRALPVFQGKAVAMKHLQGLADAGKITFTAVSNGAFLGWGLANGFLGIDLGRKKVQLMNDGTHVFPWTAIEAVGKAVATALRAPEKTKNKLCHIYSFQKSQLEVVSLAKKALGSDGWVTESVDMNAKYAAAMAAVGAGDFSFEVMADLIKYSISRPGYAGLVGPDDNELLLVETMDDEHIVRFIADIAKEQCKTN